METPKLHCIFSHLVISKRTLILFFAIFLSIVTCVHAYTSKSKLYFKISVLALFPLIQSYSQKKLLFVISLLKEYVTFKIVSVIIGALFRQPMFNTKRVQCFTATRNDKTPKHFRFFFIVYEIMSFVRSRLIVSHTLLYIGNFATC